MDPVVLEELKRRASCGIEACSGRLWGLSREIWGAPELAYQERRAHEALAGFFSGCGGWRVQRSYKLETAFRAEWQWGPGGAGGGGGGEEKENAAAAAASPEASSSSSSSEPVLRVGFLCEYDALPGLGHACGHNLIAEVGAAAALGLRAALQGSQPQPQGGHPAPAVKIIVLGTPAEEDGGGKIDLIKAGAFDGLDVVFMAHPSQEDAAYLPDVAEHDVTVKYFGKASHAAAYPWEGVNALDAAVLAYNNLSVLRQQMKPTWRVHGEMFIKSYVQQVILQHCLRKCYIWHANDQMQGAVLIL
ncbi:peptidase M20 domain-containing protein 2-like [Sceloporus undulatus]|uniref:peptidase M20 domain-containing protein 2-like n=1 Tax=Sceloporus undulatus TaxID=8520 RepID=UPI001C4B2A3C|nr:peptidase M20 domain-containing protein 2-like [Sceloporus undulatus]